jgi:hypothetical protein
MMRRTPCAVSVVEVVFFAAYEYASRLDEAAWPFPTKVALRT